VSSSWREFEGVNMDNVINLPPKRRFAVKANVRGNPNEIFVVSKVSIDKKGNMFYLMRTKAGRAPDQFWHKASEATIIEKKKKKKKK
jgi:hypothetical protein